MNLPKITTRQKDILDLLYKHRFLNRIQLQALLGHKDYKNLNLWLKDLREKQYVEWIYSTHFAEKTKPAVYYLGINAIRRFKQNDMHSEHIAKYYRESGRSQAFIDRCILLADACVVLTQANRAVEAELTSRQVRNDDIWFMYATEADYTEDGYYEFLNNTDIHPHLVYAKASYTDEETVLASYTVEVFGPTVPRFTVRKRLKNYVQFLDSEEWQSETEEDKPPIALFVCPTKADMIYCKRATKKLLEDVWETEDIHMRFTYIDKIREHGFRGKIWEEVVPPSDED